MDNTFVKMLQYAYRFVNEHPVESSGLFILGIFCTYIILSWIRAKQEEI